MVHSLALVHFIVSYDTCMLELSRKIISGGALMIDLYKILSIKKNVYAVSRQDHSDGNTHYSVDL